MEEENDEAAGDELEVLINDYTPKLTNTFDILIAAYVAVLSKTEC